MHELADRISDKIVAVLNDELKQPGFSPVEALGGQLLALKTFMASAGDLPRPRSFHLLEDLITVMLYQIKERDGL